ncbi:MAG TPA: MATE family efflux transporter [Mesorhizobium sp.]|jgi:putative MATE family efflux protein|nr:MATE family efflux transporter [Mesorhizobium sp.]
MSADVSSEAAVPGRGGAGPLTRGPIARTLLVFALPVLGANVLQSLNGSVNAVFVGRLIGADALAATANANLVLFLLLGAVFGIGMAATILVGQSMGAGDTLQARKVVGTAATFFLAVSLLFTLAGWVFAPAILRLLGTPPEALPLALPYLRVLFLAVPFLNLLAFVMTVLRGAGDSKTPFLFMGLAVGLDIVVNPFLITGMGPWPRLGIAGSALATLVGQAVALLAILVLLYRRKHPLRLAGADLKLLRPDPALLRTVVAKGVPMGLQMIVISASALILMGLVNAYGARMAAAYGVAAQLWTYAQMPALAIGAAVTAMAAQNIGAGRWDRITRITAAGVGFNLALTGALVAGLYLFEPFLLGLFLAEDREARALAEHINESVAWSFVLFGVTVVLFGTVRAAGAVTPPLVILVITLFGVRSLFAYGMQGVIGADAIWWSFPAGSIASVALAAAYYRWGRWRRARNPPSTRPAGGEPPDTGLGMPRQRARLREE